MAFSVYFSTSLKGEGMVQLFMRVGDKITDIKLQIQRWTPSRQRQEKREGLAGDKDAAKLCCWINNYSVWMCKGPATPPDHFWCVNTV